MSLPFVVPLCPAFLSHLFLDFTSQEKCGWLIKFYSTDEIPQEGNGRDYTIQLRVWTCGGGLQSQEMCKSEGGLRRALRSTSHTETRCDRSDLMEITSRAVIACQSTSNHCCRRQQILILLSRPAPFSLLLSTLNLIRTTTHDCMARVSSDSSHILYPSLLLFARSHLTSRPNADSPGFT